MTRREFLAATAAAAGVPGSVLVHEHVLVDFGGAANPGTYDPAEVFALARPKLEEVKQFGCRRFLDCTPRYLGRDAALLKRLADATGVEIWTNTGIYGAADRKGVPPHAHAATADALAAEFIAEVRKGGPRFIKTAVLNATLDELDRKLVRAAAIASRETGLTIASHTGSGAAALEQLEIMDRERVRPEKFVWVHAQSGKDHAFREKVARAGAWVEIDGLREGKSAWQVECVKTLAARGLLNRTLIANDAGWYHVGEPKGGDFLGYTYIYTGFLPQLDSAWHRALMVDNPVAAFGK
jgi:phosphotriesterase-related protein